MRTRVLWVAGLLSLLAVGLLPVSARASFHLMKITQVFPGTVLQPNAQYIELQMFSAGQNFVGTHNVIVYSASGEELGRATFAGSVATGASQSRILIATTEAATLFNITADLTIAALIQPEGGAVCFDAIDCVAFGAYAGTQLVGEPFQHHSGLTLGRAMVRDISAGTPTLEGADDTDDSAADFDRALPSPHNNAGEAGTVPANNCGDTTLQGLESCDDGNGANTDACKNNCTLPECGDGVVSTGEACDDNNTDNDDGCDATCDVESGLDASVGAVDASTGDASTGDADASTSDASVTADASTAHDDASVENNGDASTAGDASDSPAAKADDGCSCSTVGSEHSSAPWTSGLLLIGLLSLSLRRKRRALSA